MNLLKKQEAELKSQATEMMNLLKYHVREMISILNGSQHDKEREEKEREEKKMTTTSTTATTKRGTRTYEKVSRSRE